MADILLREEDLKFASTMVHTLNTILLTSSELFQLRNQLKDLKTPVWVAGAGSAARRDVLRVAGTWGCVLLIGPHLAGPRAGAQAPGVAPSFLLRSWEGLEDVPSSYFSPLGRERAPRALKQLPPPSLRPSTGQGQVTAGAEPPGPSAVPAGNAPTGFAEQLPLAPVTSKQGREREEDFSSSSC